MEKQVQGRPTILVVEDEPVTLEMTVALLEKEGFEVHRAADGRLGLALAYQVVPDLVLMDVIMPCMDGLEACRKLKADPDLRDIPVVFFTANTSDDILEAAFKSGGCDFIRKPLNRIELLSRINIALNQQQRIEKRAEAEKLRGALETAGGVCHTLNQPLQYVLGAIQILLMDLPPGDKMYETLDTIRRKVEQMGDITRKLAEVTRYRTKPHAGGQHILDIDQCDGQNDTEGKRR